MSEFKKSLRELIELTNKLAGGMDRLSGSVNKARESTQSAANVNRNANRAKKEGSTITQREISEEDILAAKKKIVSRERQREIQAMARARASKEGLITTTKRYNRSLSSSNMILNQFRGMLLRTFGAYAVITAIRNTTRTIAEFEQTMAKVRAISGATEEEFQRLSDAAKSIASEGSIFDPKTIGELQVELAKLGFTAVEIIAATRPIVNLATATGEDLSRAAEVAAATLRSFNLDATAMGATIDVMAKSFTTSALDMGRWAEAAKYAAPVASQLGWNVEQLSAIMGVLANRQIFGSLAGTSLRNIFIEISDESSELSRALDLTSSDFGEFIDKLEAANKEGLDFTRIIELLPRRAVTAGLIIAKNTEEIRKMEASAMAAAGAVREMANIQLDTITGETNQLSAAWKALVNEMDEGESVFSKAIKNTLSEVRMVLRQLALETKYGDPVSLESIIFGDEMREGYLDDYTDIIEEITDSLRGLSGEGRALESHEMYLERAIGMIPGLIDLESGISKNAEQFRWAGSQAHVLDTELQAVNATITDLTNNAASSFSAMGTETLEGIFEELNKDVMEFQTQLDTFALGVRDKNGVLISREEAEKQLEILGKLLNSIDKELELRVTSQKKEDEKAKKEAYNREKSHLALQRKLKIDQINANTELDDQEREKELEEARNHFDTKLFQLEAFHTEDAEIRGLYNKLIMVEQEKHKINIQNIDDKHNAQSLNELRKSLDKEHSIRKKMDQAELSALRQKMRELRREEVRTYSERLANAEAVAELQFEIERKAIQNQIDEVKRSIDLEKQIRDGAKDSGLEEVSEGATEELELLNGQLKKLEENLDNVTKETVNLKKGFQDIFDLSDDDWNNLITMLNMAEDAVKKWTRASVDSARERVQASNTAIAEIQRDLEMEMRLAEQGFASNVSLQRRALEEEKKRRDEALKEQEKAQRRQANINAAIDAANIVTSAVQIIRDETSDKGWYGLITGALAVGSLYALYSEWRASSKSATQYEKGGWELLDGKSHRAGGISLGEGREAEGGEMLAVFNKKATSKYGKQIAEMTDMINKDKLDVNMDAMLRASNPENVIVNVDNGKLSDVHSILKQIRDDGTHYFGDYKIIKDGNRTRKIRINAS